MRHALKQVLWKLPAPVARPAVRAAVRVKALSPAYDAYFHVGCPRCVLSGPFRGMRYAPLAVGSAWLPKLLGTYERELHPTIAALCREPCDVLIDIGSAEGYYAVGLARTLRPRAVYTYDTDPRAGRLLARIAAMNDLAPGTIRHGGFCTPAELDAALASAAESPLVVCDCEGGERDLLDPAAAPRLRTARVLVEVHDFFTPAGAPCGPIGAALRMRFEATHHVEAIKATDRRPEDWPAELAGAPPRDALAAMNESRPPGMEWLVLRPK